MDKSEIREAWSECELEETEHGVLIDPAVFEPDIDGGLVFEERPCGELWEKLKSMDQIQFMMEPLDGYLKTHAYVYLDEDRDDIDEFIGDISVRTHGDRIKISPNDMNCPYEAFEKFLNSWEDNVCKLDFLGGLEEMDVEN